MAFHGRMTHLTCHFSRGHFMRIVPRFVSGKGVVGGIPSPTRPCKYFFKTLSKPKSEDCLAPVFLVWSASCTDKACQEESGTRNHFPSNPSDGSSWVLRWSWQSNWESNRSSWYTRHNSGICSPMKRYYFELGSPALSGGSLFG